MKLQTGQIIITAGALDNISIQDMNHALSRHIQGDHGNLPPEDLSENALAIVHGRRVLSSYKTVNGTVFWIITEADRKTTTILLPEEY